MFADRLMQIAHKNGKRWLNVFFSFEEELIVVGSDRICQVCGIKSLQGIFLVLFEALIKLTEGVFTLILWFS